MKATKNVINTIIIFRLSYRLLFLEQATRVLVSFLGPDVGLKQRLIKIFFENSLNSLRLKWVFEIKFEQNLDIPHSK